ncbi:MAG: pectate lyase [Planctomycetota bacterium]
MIYRILLTLSVIGISLLPKAATAGEAVLKDKAAETLRRATDYFRTDVSTEGGYLWRYSEDLTAREGEGEATDTTVWVQPPGTPSVGMVFLTAYEATGDPYYLSVAGDAARALVRGQLRSGGWDYRIEFEPQRRQRYAYRIDPSREGARNVSTLDDDNTQSAIRLLMRVDRALDFKDEKIHEATQFALSTLLKVQYPNGAWPQRFSAPPDPAKFPVKKAGYPDSWSWTYPNRDYRSFYTFNDNTIADTITTMLEAFETYGDARYQAAAEKAGDFILLAQMPEPQPAWAQQYDADMHPVWARKFEPPAVTGGESQGVMRILMVLYRATGKKKYIEPIPRAMEYLRSSRLPDGRLARFYELKTNRPLYFTRDDYKLTYSDADTPTHYAFKTSYGLDSIANEYERLLATDPAKLKQPEKTSRPRMSQALAARIRSIIESLDEQGRWVEPGRLINDDKDGPARRVINCQTFIANVGTLSEYLAATR